MSYKPGDQPDPDFLAFFAGDWQELLQSVEIPGMDKPSWDRRAAYLYWELRENSAAVDCFGDLIPGEYQRLQDRPGVGIDEWDRAYIEWQGRPPVNHTEDADCVPTPGGVKFHFDAVKVSGDK